jgi:uncharacterized membrane protein
MTPPPRYRRLFKRLTANFLAGALVLLPLGVIGYFAWVAYGLVKQSVLPLAEKLLGPERMVMMPSMVGVLLLGLVILIGALAKGPVGRRVTQRVNAAVERIPVAGPMIGAVRQVAETVLNKQDGTLKQACLIEFPKADSWTLGLISAEPQGEIAANLPKGEDMVAVYIGPPPFTSAFLVFVPRASVIPLQMSADDEVRLLATAGIAYPTAGG